MSRPGVRPKAYHRTENRGPWLRALSRLASEGWCDTRIAAALTLLGRQHLEAWEAKRFSLGALDGLLDEAAECSQSHLPWTAASVGYYRRSLGKYRQRPSAADLVECNRIRMRAAQARRGWGHLLPRYDEEVTFSWLPGLELPPRAVAVVDLLWKEGPKTHTAIARGLGYNRPRDLLIRGRYVVLWLVSLGVLVADACRRFALHPQLPLPPCSEQGTG